MTFKSFPSLFMSSNIFLSFWFLSDQYKTFLMYNNKVQDFSDILRHFKKCFKSFFQKSLVFKICGSATFSGPRAYLRLLNHAQVYKIFSDLFILFKFKIGSLQTFLFFSDLFQGHSRLSWAFLIYYIFSNFWSIFQVSLCSWFLTLIDHI